MSHNSFCGTHSDLGVAPESPKDADRSACSAESHKVTIEVRDERARVVTVERDSFHGALYTLILDAFCFIIVALFARHDVISVGAANVLVGGVIGARLAGCRLRVRAQVSAVVAVLLGLWGVLSFCSGQA